ncbi:MAG: hypothetical protein KAS49_04885, partial [Candidatus Cloacimonetes bacterium]|nr:hypothetical protein [Candidatus Cloacimonadota bacterium]
MYRTIFINYNRNRFEHELDELGSILVVRTARDADAIAPYIQWKREKGHIVYEKEVPTNTDVTSLVAEQYAAHNDILYVQLVGDWEDIKSPLSGGAATDPNLGCVAGDDVFPELIVGRFSAKTAADVTVQVNKTITYERDAVAGAWYHKGLGIASEQGGVGKGDDDEYDYEHMDIIKENRLLPFNYTEVAEAYEFPSVSDVANPVEAGVGIINYVGHGSADSWVTSGFSNSDVANLSNGDMLPFIWSVACVNGKFHALNDCFAEAWLKKNGGGAVAMYASTINQSWDVPMRGQDYMNDLLIGGYDYDNNPGAGINVDVQKATFGSLSFNGSILMCIEDPTGGPEMLETWTIFGDASLNVRTDSPAEVTLSNETILLGVDYTTTVNLGGSPIKGALVSFYQDGVGFTGVSDASGKVTISHDLEVGKCIMVVSSYNGITIYNDAMTVVPPAGPYCICFDYDYEYGDGNNNIAEYNENGSFDLTISNVGEAQADNVKLTLTTESDFITITGANKNIGNIAANSSVEVEDAFVFEIAGNIPDQEIISFNLAMKGQETWNSELGIIVNAPVFEIGEMVINDSGNDGYLDSGETATITVPVRNIGHATSLVGSVMLSSSDSAVINVTSAISNFTTLDADTEVNVVFNVSVADNVPIATIVTMNFVLNSGEYTANKNFYPSVG